MYLTADSSMDISLIIFHVYMWAIGILLNLNAVSCNVSNNTVDMFLYDSNPSVALLQKYIQINTTTYNDLEPAVSFWNNLAAAQGVEIKKYIYKPNMPVLVLKWPGTNLSLPSIMLNSHMDVVPASEQDGWLYPPFAGQISQEQDRKIYGRGSQDMKSVSIQYYEALKRLKEKNVTLLRTVYMTLMPDEEVGAEAGMLSFLPSEEFKSMNVGIELDEGGAQNVPVIPVFFQDKVVWQIKVDCHGISGHGSSFQRTNATATGKCHNVVTNMFAFRDQQYPLFASAPVNDSSGYTSVNLDRVSGGTANNVVPNLISLTFDIRPSTKLNEAKLQQMLEQMVYSAGDNITITYISKNPQSPATMANSTNPFWNAIQSAANDLNITLVTAVPSGSTDARHVRLAGVPAFGMSPQQNTPTLLHAVNEYLGVNTFLSGIDFYEKVIQNLACVPADLARNPRSYLYNTTTE